MINLKVLKLRDLIENPAGVPDPKKMPDTNKIYRLHRVIDSAGKTIGFPDEVEVVVEVEEIPSG